MYEADFDLDIVMDQLKAAFTVEQQLPLDIQLCLEHLRRREQDDA